MNVHLPGKYNFTASKVENETGMSKNHAKVKWIFNRTGLVNSKEKILDKLEQ
jgi:hypothetical protein